MTPAGHLLSGYVVGAWVAAGGAGKSTRRWTVGAALAGGLAPDADVVFGLVGGWGGAGLHRGFTHSLPAAVAFGALAAVVARLDRRRAFLAGLAGVLTHIFWDGLNVWGVKLFWPAEWYYTAGLVHEGDLYALAIVGLAAALVWRGYRRLTVAALALLIPAYLLVQVEWRQQARLLAQGLVGRRVEVYPTGRLSCGWIAVSAGAAELAVDCVASPRAAQLHRVFTVPLREGALIHASQQSAAVREFVEKIPFSFAEERRTPDGGAWVVWRDAREAWRQKADAAPTGLHVRLNAQGAILDERHQWWLSLW